MNVSTAVAVAEDTRTSPSNHHHDIHALPPAFIQKAHWHYSSVKKAALDLDEDVVDFRRGLTAQQRNVLKPLDNIPSTVVADACKVYKQSYFGQQDDVRLEENAGEVTIYEHAEFPGT